MYGARTVTEKPVSLGPPARRDSHRRRAVKLCAGTSRWDCSDEVGKEGSLKRLYSAGGDALGPEEEA